MKRRRAALWRSSNSHYRTLVKRDRFAKQHPFDCGHARCFTCHTDKVAGVPHPQEVRAAADEQDAGDRGSPWLPPEVR